jgi:hypothetical protein
MKKKTTKIVELIIEENNQELAIDAISLVSAPAIEQDFVFFGKEKHNLTFAKVDEEKRMLVSPALIPNKQIFRYDPNTDSEYYVYFSKDTVRKASELYLKHNNHHKATYEHSDRVSGVLTVESWIIEDTKLDKSTLYGFSLPVGTWMVKLSISNEDLWTKIKAGEIKGLSIEGYFVDKMQNMSKGQFTNEQIREALREIISPKKVQLASIKDFDKLAKDSLKTVRATDKLVDNVKSQAKKALTELNKTGTLLVKVYPVYQDLEKQAKDLGVNLPKELSQEMNIIRSYIKSVDEDVKTLKAIL